MANKIAVTTSIDPDLWDYTDRVARQLGVNRNDLITKALGELLPRKEFELLQEEFINELSLSDAEDF